MFYKLFVKPFLYLSIFVFGIFTITNDNSVLHQQIQESFIVSKSKEIVNSKYIKILLDPKEIMCLTRNVLHEAGSEPIEGQAAVIRVVLNRVFDGRFPNTPCKVINQYGYVERLDENNELKMVKVCQFSWTCEEDLREINTKSQYYKDAEKLVYDIILHNHYSNLITSTTLFFHAKYVNPMWNHKKVTEIGNHIFYEKKSK